MQLAAKTVWVFFILGFLLLYKSVPDFFRNFIGVTKCRAALVFTTVALLFVSTAFTRAGESVSGIFDLDYLTKLLVRGDQRYSKTANTLILFHSAATYADKRMLQIEKNGEECTVTLFFRDGPEMFTTSEFITSPIFTRSEADQLTSMFDKRESEPETDIGRFHVAIMCIGSGVDKRTILKFSRPR